MVENMLTFAENKITVCFDQQLLNKARSLSIFNEKEASIHTIQDYKGSY